MKTHILLAAIALIVTACASHRDLASVPEKTYSDTQHAQLMESAASARGNSVR